MNLAALALSPYERERKLRLILKYSSYARSEEYIQLDDEISYEAVDVSNKIVTIDDVADDDTVDIFDDTLWGIR